MNSDIEYLRLISFLFSAQSELTAQSITEAMACDSGWAKAQRDIRERGY